MSNKQKRNIQPVTSADGDNTIHTKKGFLISLPGKKKNVSEVQTGIVPAKTVSSQANSENSAKNGAKDAQGNYNGSKGGKKNDRTRDNRNRQNKHNKGAGNVNGTTQNSNVRQEPQTHQPDAKSTKNLNGGHDKNKNKNNGKNKGGQPFARNERNNDFIRNDKKQKGRRNDYDDSRNKERRVEGLSPLSSDMMNFGKVSREDISAIKETKINDAELSLEEKYKDAIPLADQIAAENAKRAVKPHAMLTEKIDRSETANSLFDGKDKGEDEKLPEIPNGSKFEVVGVRFREAGKVYYFDPDGKDIAYGTPVIVETARGAEYGYTAISNRLVPNTSIVPPLKKIKRIATASDTEKFLANKELEKSAGEVFKQKVAELKLEMNLVFVEYTFDNSKLLFYFTAETRIDFRELVKELASVFRTRIELRQIGVRDEAKMLGGLGVCGRSVCCNSFLGDFAQVSIKMAKEQGLSLNSAKISGACGKLMCCLRFEDKVYSEEMARTPKVGSVVETPDGKGVVIEANALKGIVKVTLENAPEAPAKPFDRAAVKVIGFNKAAVKDDDEDMKELAELEDK